MSEFRTSDLPIGLVRLIVAASPVLTDEEIAQTLEELSITWTDDKDDCAYFYLPAMNERRVKTIREWYERRTDREALTPQATETTTALSRLRQDVEALETRLTDVAQASRSEYKSNARVLDAITDYLSRPWWQRLFSRYGGNK